MTDEEERAIAHNIEVDANIGCAVEQMQRDRKALYADCVRMRRNIWKLHKVYIAAQEYLDGLDNQNQGELLQMLRERCVEVMGGSSVNDVDSQERVQARSEGRKYTPRWAKVTL